LRRFGGASRGKESHESHAYWRSGGRVLVLRPTHHPMISRPQQCRQTASWWVGVAATYFTMSDETFWNMIDPILREDVFHVFQIGWRCVGMGTGGSSPTQTPHNVHRFKPCCRPRGFRIWGKRLRNLRCWMAHFGTFSGGMHGEKCAKCAISDGGSGRGICSSSHTQTPHNVYSLRSAGTVQALRLSIRSTVKGKVGQPGCAAGHLRLTTSGRDG
jgi:hypothetical protein